MASSTGSEIKGQCPPSQRIIEALFQLSYQSWRPCRLLGQTMFLLNSKNELVTSPCDLSTFVAIVKIALAGVSVWVISTDETLIELFNHVFGKISSVAYSCQAVQLFNAILADIFCAIAMLHRRKEIVLFQQNLTNFIVEVSAGDVGLQIITVESIGKVRNHVRYHQILIFGSSSFQISGSLLVAILFLLNLPDNLKAYLWTWQLQAIPILTFLWTFIVVLRLIGRLSLVGVFRVLETCTSVLETRLIKELKTRLNGNTPITHCLRRYKKLEEIVSEINGTFGIYLAVDMLSLIVANAILLFQLGVHLNSDTWRAFLSACTLLMIHVDATWAICSAAYHLENGARRVIQLIQELAVTTRLSTVDYTKVNKLVTVLHFKFIFHGFNAPFVR